MGEEKKSASSFEAMRRVVGQNGGVVWEASGCMGHLLAHLAEDRL